MSMASAKKDKISGEGKRLSRHIWKKSVRSPEWFDAQEEIDLEEALKKVRDASDSSRQARKTQAAENEFKEIKKEIDGEE